MFEKKRGTRFLASVMALVMLLSLAPVGALAAGETPTNEECSAVNQPAVGDENQQDVVDTENTNENTPTKPTEDSDSAEATKSEGGLDESYSNADTSNNDNGIAVQNFDNDRAAEEQTITAEYWVTNGRASVDGNQSMVINSADFSDNQEKSISEIAPGEGAFPGNQKAVFRFAKVLSGNQQQQEYQEDRTSDTYGKKVESIRYSSTQGFQYKATDGNWYTFNSWNDQLVFYYLIKTNFVKDISVYITDWPTVEETDQSKYQVNYKVWELPNKDSELTAANLLEGPVKTYYNKDMTVSVIKVAMNDSEQYFVHKVTVDSKNNENESELIANDSEVTFSLNLANADSLAERNEITINIYVTAYKYQLNYEANGGNINDSNYSEAGSYLPNAPIIAPMNVTKTGYTFAGWYTDEACTDANEWNNGNMPSQNLMLYAKWNKNSYTVTYKDGDAQSNGVDTVEYNSQVRVRPGLTKEGHIFNGWKSDADDTTYSPDQTFTMPAQNVTLTAQWTKTDSPVVPSNLVKAKFFINLGGKDASKPDGTGTFTKGGIEIEDAINFDVFDANRKYGYGNNGYIFNENGVKTQYPSLLTEEPTNKQVNDALSAVNRNDLSVDGEGNRYVVWYHVSDCTNMRDGYHVDGYIKNAAIKITYNPNGGIFAGEETSKNHVVDGKSGEVHQIIQDTPARDGYIFNGWKLEGSENIYQPNGSITPTGDVTLVAQWRVTLTYHENFGNTEHTYTISFDEGSTQTVQSYAELRRLYGVFGENTGFYFDKWTTQADGKGTSYKKGNTISMTGSIDLYAQWKKARVAYTINQHFMDGEGKPSVANPDITTNKTTKNAQTTLDSLITDGLKKSKTGTDGKTYVYVPSETKFTLNDKAVTALVDGTEIHLYYYLDEVGGTPEKEGADRPDGIPDAWQHKVTFQVVNGNWNVSKNNKNIVVYVNAKNQAGEVLDSKLTASQIPAVGSEPNSGYEASGSWDKTLSDGLVINADTTFTFTYSKRSSSGGSSRPSTPTVTIPDDVPTGLNGKDHYAYIIGYGNNDVRPQNNITRAEVATIFFRLLTDETREANMTKSNGYNDVKDGDWFCCAVSTLSKMGIIKGYEDGSFKPNDPISRAEFAAIAARFDPDGDKTPATFADVTSHWAKDEISIAANHGWIKGYEDGSFKPDQKITRAETMTLVNRVLNRLPEAKDDLHKDMKTWVDNMDETAWYYLAVQEATNSHYFKNKTGTKFEQWTDLRDTRDWSELEK